MVEVAEVKVARETVRSLAVLSQRKFASDVILCDPLKKETWPVTPPLAVKDP